MTYYSKAYQDPDHHGNKIRPKVRCVGCGNLGCITFWGPWCFPCNVERMDRLSAAFDKIADSLGIAAMTACPKPEKPRRGDAECRRYVEAVKQLPCCICGIGPPSEAHHVTCWRFARRKSSDMDVIPLCWFHHDIVTNYRAMWLEMVGPDTAYLPATRKAVRKLQEDTI